MPNIADLCNSTEQDPVFICDFSPPRSGDVSKLEPAKDLIADVISIAYSPGRSPCPDTLASSIWITQNTKSQSLMNLTTRDMNKLAIQNKLLGAEMLGVSNVLAIQGDQFTTKENSMVKTVNDYTPTNLLMDANNLNRGLDFKGNKLHTPTNLCVGTSINPNKNPNTETALTYKKVSSGSKFFITQPIFNIQKTLDFQKLFSEKFNSGQIPNVFWGIQILSHDNFSFSPIPENLTRDISKGRTGIDIAIEQIQILLLQKMKFIYLIPTIHSNGKRDYHSAKKVIEFFKS